MFSGKVVHMHAAVTMLPPPLRNPGCMYEDRLPTTLYFSSAIQVADLALALAQAYTNLST